MSVTSSIRTCTPGGGTWTYYYPEHVPRGRAKVFMRGDYVSRGNHREPINNRGTDISVEQRRFHDRLQNSCDAASRIMTGLQINAHTKVPNHALAPTAMHIFPPRMPSSRLNTRLSPPPCVHATTQAPRRHGRDAPSPPPPSTTSITTHGLLGNKI